jgi:hypothetical protein
MWTPCGHDLRSRVRRGDGIEASSRADRAASPGPHGRVQLGRARAVHPIDRCAPVSAAPDVGGQSSLGRWGSAENALQILIMLVIGLAAGAGSFRHVHDVAATHGQAGWLAWADAVVLELISIASRLELRRRERMHQSLMFPAAVMGVAVVLSLSAQVVDAEPSRRSGGSRRRSRRWDSW